jgi:hypothetical protein
MSYWKTWSLTEACGLPFWFALSLKVSLWFEYDGGRWANLMKQQFSNSIGKFLLGLLLFGK